MLLVIDDTPDGLSLIAGLLSPHYQVLVANRGEQGLRLAQRQPAPDLILLDIMMPLLDGYQVCRQLKSDAETQDIPVIFLTGKASIEDEQMGFAEGAVD